MTILSKSVVLKEQDSKQVIKRITHLLLRLGKLYLIPNWDEENSVILAEWVYDNYAFETLDCVEKVLQNPPETFDERGNKEHNWRLTPINVSKWMAVQLDKEAIQREKEAAKYKEQFKEALPDVNYESFKNRLAKGEALQDPKPENPFKETGYQDFKNEYIRKHILNNPPKKAEENE